MKIHFLNILLPTCLSVSLAAAAQTNSKLPSEITTLGGKTYHGVAAHPRAVYPDGIVITFQPQENGQPVTGAVGEAKLKFSDLPEDVAGMFPHNAKAAAEYESQQAQALGQRLAAQAADEQAIMRYIHLAEWNSALTSDADASYSVAMDTNGKVSAQGYARPFPSQTIKSVSVPGFTYFAQRNPLFNWPDYVPVATAPAGTTPVVITK